MESTPPDLPSGLRPKPRQLKKASAEKSTAVVSNSSSCGGVAAVSPALMESIAPSILDIDATFIPNTENERSQRVARSIKGIPERTQTASASASASEMPYVTPRSIVPSSFSFPKFSFGISHHGFFKKRPLKEKKKGKKKEKEKEEEGRKYQGMLFLPESSELLIQHCPAGHRGYLEQYPQKSATDPDLRRILGINSFSDVASIGLFSPHMVNLDRSKKVLVSRAAIIRMASETKVGTHKNLLKALGQYDRHMSYWLSANDIAYKIYAKCMENIFFKIGESENIYSVFNAIPLYIFLQNEIKQLVPEDQYKIIHDNLNESFEQYERSFSSERRIESLKEIVCNKDKEIESIGQKENSEYDNLMYVRWETENQIKAEEGMLIGQYLELFPEFIKGSNLKTNFFEKLVLLREQEEKERLENPDQFPLQLPVWGEWILCPKGMLEVALYFFATLCKRRPKFYDFIPGDKIEDIYVNEDFMDKIETLKTAKSFAVFMQEQKKEYQEGLVEIVLYKTLEYVCQYKQFKIEYCQIISNAVQQANARFRKYRDEPFCAYGIDFFEEAVGVMFNMLHTLQEEYEQITVHSGPAPKL